MVKIVCWNINRSTDAYKELQKMDADVALLQEVGKGAAKSMAYAIGGAGTWDWKLSDRWPAVAKLSNRVKVEWFKPVTILVGAVDETEISVSDIRTLPAARVAPLEGGQPFIVFSMYARWLSPHPLVEKTADRRGKGTGQISIYSDSSAHRIISDLSTFIGHTNPSTHRILAAGDLNTILGETRLSLPERDGTVFARMKAIGLKFIGPQCPQGKQANPAPQGLPADTKNVPTYLTNQQKRNMLDSGALSGNQLDYVFASRGFHNGVRVHARNDRADWGPSDHCRIVIEVQ